MKKRKRNRLKNFDYSRDALYFVTPCIKGRIHYFGEVYNGKMITNKFGKIAENQWDWLAEQYPYVILHAFVVMPNHIHGIIEINRNHIVRPDRDNNVRTGRDLSLQPQPKIKPLPQLIGAYKTTVSKQIHLIGGKDFAWHRSFHDHIIRNDAAYYRISHYIEMNPQKWLL
jgi:REP element-mobilizing transposase RayT